MTVIANQTPPSRKRRRHRGSGRDWFLITLAAGGAWFGFCWLVAWLVG